MNTQKKWLRQILDGPADHEEMTAVFPWAPAMIGCPHDDLYHAEGDPWTHTTMVVSELEQGAGFGNLSETRKAILRLAAWMHDIAKPATTEVAFCDKEKRVRVRQPNHAPIGARMAWQGLVDAGCDPLIARDVHALVFWHQRPHHMLGQNNVQARVLRFAADTHHISWLDLLRLCRADNLGRVAPNISESLEELDLLEMFISEMGHPYDVDLLNGSWPYVTDEARLAFLRSSGNQGSPHMAPPDPSGSRMILMSGLPGSGKNTVLKNRYPDLPVVELDALREARNIDPGDNQGRVLQAAFEEARTHLRQGRDFAWNATGLTRLTRQKIIGLARDYGAWIEAISLDVPFETARQRNSARAKPVPEAVMLKLAAKREPVLADEAHRIWSVDIDDVMRPCLDVIQDIAGDEPAP